MKEKITLNIAILTISDSRTPETDKSGNILKKLVEESGHNITDKNIVKDNIYAIRNIISTWIDDKKTDVVITTGGTGVTGTDGTPEALSVLLDKKLRVLGKYLETCPIKK